MNRISLQLIATVFVAFALFAVGVASIIGYQAYHDMKDIAFERVEGAAKLFSAEYENQVNSVSNALRNMEGNAALNHGLKNLNIHGPSYNAHLSATNKQPQLSRTNQQRYLQSQLELARDLLHALPVYHLSSIAVYHTDPLQQYDFDEPLLSLVLDHHHIWLYLYQQKGSSSHKIYRLPIEQLSIDQVHFKPSYSIEKILHNLGAHLSSAAPHDYLNNIKHSEKSRAGAVLNLETDKFNTAVWSPVSFSVKIPHSKQVHDKYGAILLAIQEPDSDQLTITAKRVGTELAIVDDEHVWVASITEDQTRNEGINVDVGERPFIFSEATIELPSDNGANFQVMALTSIEGLKQRVQKLIWRLTLITLVTSISTGLVLYLLIRRILSKPLSKLMRGVNEIQKGNWQHRVELDSHNELHTLAHSFNEMTHEIEQKSEALIQAKDHLEEKVKDRTEQLENAQNQLILSEKMASLGQLVAGVAHEINTPLGNSLTALSFNTDGLKAIQKKFDDKQLTVTDFGQYLSDSRESSTLMENNLRKASELVNTFKNVAVNQSVEELVDFSLKDEVNEVLITLRPKLKQSQVQIALDIDAAIRLHSFPGAYYHIISNLIMNCLKHAFPDNKGNITIKAQLQDGSVELSFKDDGVGMDEVTLSKIFDPFYTTKRGQGGTGLGMYMTYNIITQRLLGKVNVISEPGKGAEFIFLLPLVNEEINPESKGDLSL